jgi:hypothetical protein
MTSHSLREIVSHPKFGSKVLFSYTNSDRKEKILPGGRFRTVAGFCLPADCKIGNGQVVFVLFSENNLRYTRDFVCYSKLLRNCP